MNRPVLLFWSFVAGLVGGILIIVGAFVMTMMMAMMGGMMGMMPMTDHSMGMGGMMDSMGLWMIVWAGFLGAVILVGALQVRSGKSVLPWGIALIVAGVLSFPTMGGFLVGAVATISSGVLALMTAAPMPPDAAGTPPTTP